jgi:2-hydroxycyclohexanecarboxyl-CoA dehydrogenase
MDAIVDHLVPDTAGARAQFRDKSVAKNIQHRLLDPAEVANAVAFLATDEAKAITGQAINVCGGLVLF